MASLGSFKKGIVYTKGGLGQTGISTSTGAAPAPTFQFGNALSFDGVNDYVSIGSPVSMSSEATVNIWVKFSDLNTRLISDTSNTAVIWTPTSTSVRVYCGGNFQDFVVPAMSLGIWYMLTVTRDAANGWRVYLNGTESTSGLKVRPGTFNVNRLGNLGSTYSDIVLDEVSILEGTTASDIQIASLYNSGNGANANTVLGSTSLYYRLNGSGTDITAIDDSGNSNTGTLNNFTGTYWVEHIALDPDATAYITAAGITDPTEQAAVNQLVLDLKGSGSTTNNTDVWGSSYAIYPLSPTSLAAAEYNLKDPTTNITWLNSPTHAVTGITGNGVNAYGLTGYNSASLGWDKSNAGLTYSGEYSEADYPLGSLQNPKFFGIRNASGFKGSYVGSNSTAALAATTARNVATASRTSTTSNKMFINGVQIAENINSELNDLPNVNIMVLALANGASPFAPFAGEIDFVALHTGLTNNQAKDLSDAITTYNTAVRIDPDATAYITAAGITDPTEQAAVFQLVSDLKGTGSTTNNTDVWSDSYGIYPLSPTSLTAAEYNLKDPTKNITWYNSPTHATTGITGNGSNAYGDTGINILNDIGSNNFGMYVRVGSQNTNNEAEMGAIKTSSPYDGGQVIPYFSNNDSSFVGRVSNDPLQASRTGLIGVQQNAGNVDRSLNGSIYGSEPCAIGTAQNLSIFILARAFGASANLHTTKTHSFYAITEGGLSANQIKDLYDAITTYNTAVR
jgi:hypothetical protein